MPGCDGAKVRAMPAADGTILRAWRRSRGWDVPEMARQLRRAARGAGQTVAAHTGLVRMVRAWERDDHQLSERYELLYAMALNIDLARLREWPAELEQERRDLPGDLLSRYDFLRLSTSVVSLLDVMRSYPAPDLAGRVSAAVAGRVRIDGEMADGLTGIVLGYRKIYRSAGAASMLGPVSETLNLLTELAPGAGEYQDLLVSLIGQAGSLAGVILMLDQGDFATAQRYLAIAARAAQQVADNELLAVAFGCRAFHSAYGGNPAGGVAFAAEALGVAARGIHPLSHGWVAAVASEMHATAGDEASCMRALETAETQLSLPSPAQPWKGIGAFSAAKLSAYRGGDLMRLTRYRDARTHLRDALTQLDPVYAKHRCTAYIDLSWAYVLDGKPDEGVRHAMDALDIVASTRHADSIRRVESLHETIRQTGTLSARDLGSKLMQVKAAS